MNQPKKRPGALWLLFYGRQRRGVPWLLASVLVAVGVLALTFAIPGASGIWRDAAPYLFGILVLAALIAAVVASLRPRRRR